MSNSKRNLIIISSVLIISAAINAGRVKDYFEYKAMQKRSAETIQTVPDETDIVTVAETNPITEAETEPVTEPVTEAETEETTVVSTEPHIPTVMDYNKKISKYYVDDVFEGGQYFISYSIIDKTTVCNSTPEDFIEFFRYVPADAETMAIKFEGDALVLSHSQLEEKDYTLLYAKEYENQKFTYIHNYADIKIEDNLFKIYVGNELYAETEMLTRDMMNDLKNNHVCDEEYESKAKAMIDLGIELQKLYKEANK